jgi:hypothetical protein
MAVLALVCLWLNATGLLTGILLGDMALIPPNHDDRLNMQLAMTKTQPDYCGLISSEAAVVHLLAPQGRQAAYYQSECYFDLAVMLRDDLTCASVHPLITTWWDGSEISPGQCAAQVYASVGRAPGGDGSRGEGGPLKAGSPLSTPVAQAMPAGAPLSARSGVAGSPHSGGPAAPGRVDGESQEQHQDEEQQKFQDAWENWKRSRTIEGR